MDKTGREWVVMKDSMALNGNNANIFAKITDFKHVFFWKTIK